MSTIQIKDVSLIYTSHEGSVLALDNISLEIGSGEFVCLVGPSGCGKSTTLNVVAGFLQPTSGAVLVDGQQVRGQGMDRGVVFQEYALFPWRTALKNVEFGLELKGVPTAERRDRAMHFLRMVKLERFAKTYPHHLSGGMKQRVAIARALAYDPRVLLLDEPFGALDALTREELQQMVVDLWEQTGKTVLYVTHNLAEAVFLSDRTIVLTPQPGRIQADVAIDLPRPRSALTVEFLDYQRRLTELILQPQA
jgi:ABC-type nitrate/sulfonate/bicarbonate transport system ATPase subunit